MDLDGEFGTGYRRAETNQVVKIDITHITSEGTSESVISIHGGHRCLPYECVACWKISVEV